MVCTHQGPGNYDPISALKRQKQAFSIVQLPLSTVVRSPTKPLFFYLVPSQESLALPNIREVARYCLTISQNVSISTHIPAQLQHTPRIPYPNINHNILKYTWEWYVLPLSQIISRLTFLTLSLTDSSYSKNLRKFKKVQLTLKVYCMLNKIIVKINHNSKIFWIRWAGQTWCKKIKRLIIWDEGTKGVYICWCKILSKTNWAKMPKEAHEGRVDSAIRAGPWA